MKEYEELQTIEQVDNFIDGHALAFLFISRTGCSVCEGLFPQVRDLLDDYPQIHMGHINSSHVEEIAGRFSIFTVPVILLFVEGKEYMRKARIVPMDILEEELTKIYTAYLD